VDRNTFVTARRCSVESDEIFSGISGSDSGSSGSVNSSNKSGSCSNECNNTIQYNTHTCHTTFTSLLCAYEAALAIIRAHTHGPSIVQQVVYTVCVVVVGVISPYPAVVIVVRDL